MSPPPQAAPDLAPLRRAASAIAEANDLALVVLFGFMAGGVTHPGSDVDLAIRGRSGPLTSTQIWDLHGAFGAACPERPVDLVDLATADPLLLRQIFQRGAAAWHARGVRGRAPARIPSLRGLPPVSATRARRRSAPAGTRCRLIPSSSAARRC